ncbi:MAG: sulfurtransferase [Balneolaceae bacterium]
MRFSILSVLFLLLVSACSEQTSELDNYPNSHLLTSAQELNELIQQNNIFLIDAREEINGEVIPGATHFPAVSSLIDQENPVEFYLTGPEAFQELMQDLGLNNDDRVVLYDDGNALAAARLFYALDYYGFSNASVLNGGFEGWLSEELPTENEPVTHEVGNFAFDVQELKSCDFDYVMAASGSDDKIIFDARSADEYSGVDERAEKNGRIPNAVNLEWNKVLEQEGVPYFQSAQDIQDQYSALGITPDKEVIPHCHTNVRGSHAYFTLRLMGYDSVRPYEGSWSEYGNRDEAIVE